MSIVHLPPRVADAVMSNELGHEKASQPFHVDLKVEDLTLDGRGISHLSEPAVEIHQAINGEESPKLSQSPNEAVPAPVDGNVAIVHHVSPEGDLAEGWGKALEVSEIRAEALEDESLAGVLKDATEKTPPLSNEKAVHMPVATKEAGFASGDEKGPDAPLFTAEVIKIVPDGKQGDSTEVTETSSKILDVIFKYALNKCEDTKEQRAAGVPKFLSVIAQFVRERKQLQMCLPAFPFKSANKVYKVLGTLPDKAEELALGRLNSMCACIEDLYQPGAKLTIISDGLVYNDLLSISDQDTWAYGEALRAMAAQKDFTHIGFSRLRDLITFPNMPEELQEISYVANATNFRHFLLNKYGKDDINIEQEIAGSPDTLMTYRGYCRFLESDLQHIFVRGKGRTNNGYKREVKYLAKQMLIRGYAFAAAVKANFPDHLRLSIHQSTGEHKVSMSLLNTKTGFTTPWHCSVALMADGEWISAPMGDFREDRLLEIVQEDGRPSYFREVKRKRPYLDGGKSFGDSQQALKA